MKKVVGVVNIVSMIILQWTYKSKRSNEHGQKTIKKYIN